MAYSQKLKVRFEDVDYAQIVYFPRLFGYCHWVFEDFFEKEVGVPYSEILSKRRIGFPTVHADADFRAPLRFGDTCRVEMEATALSSRSATHRYRMFREAGDVLCAEVTIVTVAIDLEKFTPLTLPVDVRSAFERHRV